MKWFPNGFGTRASLAHVVVLVAVGAAAYHGEVMELLKAATLVLVFYFSVKAVVDGNNGGNGNGENANPVA